MPHLMTYKTNYRKISINVLHYIQQYEITIQ